MKIAPLEFQLNHAPLYFGMNLVHDTDRCLKMIDGVLLPLLDQYWINTLKHLPEALRDGPFYLTYNSPSRLFPRAISIFRWFS